MNAIFKPLMNVRTLLIIVLTLTAIAPESQALPRDRIAGRQTSRARRRACFGLPVGAAVFIYGGYRYYRAGSRYYYPYSYNGRTVYIDIEVKGGYPAPPPPAASIDIDIY